MTSIGSGSVIPPYTPDSEMVPPRLTIWMASISAASRSTPTLRSSGSERSLGSSPVIFWAISAPGEPWASVRTASMTESGPRPPVRSRMAAGTSSHAERLTTVIPCRRAISSRSGTLSTA